MGSCRGSSQLTRLRTYGLAPSCQFQQPYSGTRHCSRHSYRHGGRRHAIQDILDELFARLHLSTRPVEGHQIRYHSLKKPQELGCALNRVGNLQPHNVTPWSTDMLGFNL